MKLKFLVLLALFSSGSLFAAISSMSFPAVVRSFDANNVVVEFQEKKMTVAKTAITAGTLKEGQAVTVTLEGEQILKYAESLQKK